MHCITFAAIANIKISILKFVNKAISYILKKKK